MDSSFHSQISGVQRHFSFLASLLKIFYNALNKLVGFFQLTEEEQRDVGIYLDYPESE
jgi:hypothetical protein